MITKKTKKGLRTYSQKPIPDVLKSMIRDVFGDLLDDKFYVAWDVYSKKNPKYMGVFCIGSLPVAIAGDLLGFYKLHLDFKNQTMSYEVYAENQSSFVLPNDISDMMAKSEIYKSSIKTDSDYVPIEWTTYYRKNECVSGEYEELKKRVNELHPNGFMIAIKNDGENLSYEEYGND